MEKYKTIKELPDAHIGTEVIFDEKANAFYYLKDAGVFPHTKNYLTKGQVMYSPDWFQKIEKEIKNWWLKLKSHDVNGRKSIWYAPFNGATEERVIEFMNQHDYIVGYEENKSEIKESATGLSAKEYEFVYKAIEGKIDLDDITRFINIIVHERRFKTEDLIDFAIFCNEQKFPPEISFNHWLNIRYGHPL